MRRIVGEYVEIEIKNIYEENNIYTRQDRTKTSDCYAILVEG